MRHLIVRQELNLRIGDAEAANGMEVRARDTFLEEGTRRLTRVFDEIAPNDEVIRLDRVVIDLGHFETPAFADAFGDSLERIARAQLKASVETREIAHSQCDATSADRFDTPARSGKSGADPNRVVTAGASATRIDRTQEVIEFITYFLTRGTAPWWSSERYQGDPESAATIGRSALDIFRETPEFRHRLYESLLENPRFVLARLTGEPWLRELAEHLRALGRQFAKRDEPTFADTTLEELRKSRTSASAAQDSEASDDAYILLGIVSSAPPEAGARIPSPATDEHGEASTRPQEASVTSGQGRRGDSLSSILAEIAGSDTSGKIIPFPSPIENAGDAERDGQPAGEAEQTAYVDGAGIVLLQPFVSMLFQELGLTADGAFLSEQSRSAAVRVLEYLVWGTNERAEFALTLEKHLCGIPTGHPLTGSSMRPSDIAEIEKVLNAVISHWSALKNTGIDGLRESFLRRPGKLIRGDDEDRLIVERQSIDVLLSRVPWAWSVVKLPWMPRPLSIEW